MAEPENQDSDQEDQDLPMEIENGHISDNNSDYNSTSERDSPGKNYVILEFLKHVLLILRVHIDEDLELVNSITGEYDRDIPTTHGVNSSLK